ncbi:MAG TPA: ABC transporter permease subunit [Spirochaetota bacterium]|nr:ABC transporter permease subunit [Spirochaetota bacterium]HOL56280.1 ABC transporter permease subunit [Spirochaetota bacterium]HPP03712.1 ABC transporter permease subunit [Spirochaetota bacterium]
MKISPITERRIKRFLKIKRAWISLLILTVFYIISLFSELLVNDKPLIIKYNNKIYLFAAYRFYSDKTFGGKYDTEADYKKLKDSQQFKNNKDNFMIFPIIPYGPYKDDLENLKGYPPTPPDFKHILGTDDRGRDVFARLLYGFRVSMTFSILLLIFEILIGVIVGGIQGYLGGIVDITLQRIIEILSSLPFLYIVILLGHTIGKGFIMLIVVISIFNWIGLSYYIRAEFLRIKQFQFVEAAKSMGSSHVRILFSEILPNALTPIISFTPFSLIAGISILSSLDFLGFGLPAPTPSWGELIRQGTENLNCYWLSVFPFVALFLTLLLTAFVGEGIREAMDPKEYSKYE